jgi:hypothetical protein
MIVDTYYFATLIKLKKLRSLMKAGEFYLSNIPIGNDGRFCEYCSYQYLCKKVPFSRDRQMHHGKKKILKKSK